jgi:nucleotide-binding universal stress UspA family protein
MARHVLVPVDGSPLSTTALDTALETFPDASVTVLYVIDPVESVYAVESGGLPVADDWYDQATARAESIFEAATDTAGAGGRAVDTATVVGRPAREILGYVDDHGVDHVVMGSHGRRGFDRLLLGSVAETVLRRSTVPVTVVR